MLQSRNIIAGPEHVLPLMHCLLLDCLPPPQVAEHPLQLPHWDHLGTTGWTREMSTIITRRFVGNPIVVQPCGQDCVLQGSSSMLLPWQLLPPSQVRRRDRVPPLQVLLQALHDPQLLQLDGTGMKYACVHNSLLMCSAIISYHHCSRGY